MTATTEAVRYKIWAQIERVDDDDDTYENVDEEQEIGCFDTLEEAQEAMRRLELTNAGT